MKNLIILITAMVVASSSYGKISSISREDIQKLYNDKEVESKILSKKEIEQLKSNKDLNTTKIRNALYRATNDLVQDYNPRCELKLIDLFKDHLSQKKINVSEDSLDLYFRFLRAKNHIDDIYLALLINISKDYHELNNLKDRKVGFAKLKRKNIKAILDDNDIAGIYRPFSSWPNESSTCVYQEFNILKSSLYNPNKKKLKNRQKLRLMKFTNLKALQDSFISKDTFNKIEYLRKKSFITKRTMRLEDYYEIIFKAKNQMKAQTLSYEIDDITLEENKFSTKRIKWYRKLTRRTKLYQKYNATQIILLAQVIQKASWRMGTDPDVISSTPVITQNFTISNPDGTTNNYVEKIELDPQSQYNLARKRMRKDIHDLQMMDVFYKKTIFYEEIVMAAFESGYITIEDLEYVVQYDDLWNPSKTKFERIIGYIFRFTGLSMFFVPPPFNVAATLALTVVEGVVNNKMRKGADNDNPATFID